MLKTVGTVDISRLRKFKDYMALSWKLTFSTKFKMEHQLDNMLIKRQFYLRWKTKSNHVLVIKINESIYGQMRFDILIGDDSSKVFYPKILEIFGLN